MVSGILRFFAVARQTRRPSVAAYATTPSILQRKLTMSKRRLRPKPQATLGPSIPICALLILITAYMTFITRKTSSDDTVFR